VASAVQGFLFGPREPCSRPVSIEGFLDARLKCSGMTSNRVVWHGAEAWLQQSKVFFELREPCSRPVSIEGFLDARLKRSGMISNWVVWHGAEARLQQSKGCLFRIATK
jgi:hypothetical protein